MEFGMSRYSVFRRGRGAIRRWQCVMLLPAPGRLFVRVKRRRGERAARKEASAEM